MISTPTGSMSESPIVGSLDFLEDGTITIFANEKAEIEEEVAVNFKATAEFIFYALSRNDWMTEFFLARPEIFDSVIEKFEEKRKGPELVLIKGGKED